MTASVDDLFAGDREAPVDPRPRIRGWASLSVLGHVGATILGVLGVIGLGLLPSVPADLQEGWGWALLAVLLGYLFAAPATFFGAYAWVRAGEEAARARSGVTPEAWARPLEALRGALQGWLYLCIASMTVQTIGLGWLVARVTE